MGRTRTLEAPRRGVRAAIAVTVALAIGIGLSLVATSPVSAAISVGSITGTSPLTSMSLSGTFVQQLVSSSVSASGVFYNGSANPGSSYNRLFAGSSSTATSFAAGTQTYGGTGTRLDPYYLQTVATSTAAPANVTQTNRLSYVNGDTFYRMDVTLLNTAAAPVTMNFYRYADCYLAGSDSGVSPTPTTSTQCNNAQTGVAMIPVTPGYSLQSGHYSPIAQRVSTNQGLTNTCLNVNGAVLTDAVCRVTNQDNGFALAWASQTLNPGEPVVLTYLTNYAATAPSFADLSPSTTVSASPVAVGDTITYTLSVTNNGPSSAPNTTVVAARPSQFTYVSSAGTGSYNATTGTWTVGTLANGASASLTITARANAVGTAQFGIQAANSDNIDNTICAVGSTTNCGPQPTVIVQGPSVATSSFTVSSGTRIANGTEAHTITATILTADGLPVTGQQGALVATATPSTGVSFSPFTATGTPGVYTAGVLSTRTGTIGLTVTVPVSGTPTALPVQSGGNANAVFVAGPPTTGNSTATIDDALPRVADNDQYHVVTVALKDATGNPVVGSAGLITAAVTAGVNATAFTETAVPGTYIALVRSTVAGAQSVTPQIAAGSIATVVAHFVAGEIDLDSTGTALELTTAGTRVVADPSTVIPSDPARVHTVRATLADAFGNPIAGQAVTFDLPDDVEPVAGASVTVVTNASGIAELAIATEVAGSYPITASVAGGEIANGSPVAAVFVPDAPAFGAGATMIEATDGAAEANGIAAHTVTVTVRDQFGNQVPGATVTLALPAGLALAPGSTDTGTSDADGLFVADVTSTVADSYSVTATVAGAPVTTGSPATVLFAAGAPSAEQSTFSVTPASPIVVGSQYIGTMTIRDATGNPVPGAAASFTVPDDLSIVEPGPYLADAAGEVQVHFTSELVGTYTVTAGIGGDEVGDPAVLGFIAGAPDVNNPETTLARTSEGLVAEANGSTPHEITATVIDQFGNPVPGAPVTFAVPSGVTVAGGGPSTVSTNAEGHAIIELVSTIAATYSVTATVGGAPIVNGSPVALTFVAGAVSQENSSLTITPAGPLTVGTGAANTYTAVIHVADAFDNPVSGAQATLESAPLLTQSAVGGVTDLNGDVTITLTSTVAGTFAITATARATRLGALPDTQQREYVADAPDLGANGQSTLTVTAGARIANGSDPHTLTATLRDEFGNPIAGQDVAFDLPTGLTTAGSAVVATNASGVATLAVTSVIADSYAVSAYAASSAGSTAALIANGDPAVLTFVAGPASTSVSALVVTPSATPPLVVGTGVANTYAAVATIRDANGNPVSGVDVAFAVAGTPAPTGGQPALSANEQTSGADGTVTVTATSTLAGSFTLAALIAGQPISGSPAPLAWSPAPADPTNSQLVLSTGTRIADGIDAHTATITARDAYGNVLIEPVSFALTVQAPALGSGTVTTDASGTVVTPITSTVSGEFAVSATLAGAPIPGSGTVDFGPSTADADQSTITADPALLTADGTSVSTITVRLFDGNNNPLVTGGDIVTLTTSAGSLGTVTDNGDGSHTAILTAPTSVGTGIATVGFTVNGITSDKVATIALVPGAANATTSTIAASPSAITADGVTTSTVTVTLHDANGNPLTIGGDTVALATTAGTLGTVTDNGDGTYTATLTSSTSAGTATLSFTVNTAASPATTTVAFLPGAASADTATIAASPASVVADGITTSAITVTLKDANGNPLTTSGGTVTMNTTAGTLGPVTDNSDGTYTATLTSSTTAGTATLSFTVNTAASPNTATVTFETGDADAASSTIAAERTTLVADGSTSTTVTVTVRDVNGNQLPSGGATVTMSTTGGSISSVTDNGDGTYTAMLTSPTASGVGTVSFTLDGAAGAETVTVTFTPGVSSPSRSTIEASPASIIADGVTTSTVTVELLDSYDNPIAAGGDTVVLATTAGVLGPVTDNGDGTYTATLTSPTVVGSTTLSFTVNGASATARATVQFVPGPAAGTTSTIAASPGSLVAGSGTTSAVTVTAFDAQGNRVPTGGDSVTITTTAGTIGSVTDNGNGTYTATLTAGTAVTTATIEFTIGGAAGSSTATVVFVLGPPSPADSTIAAAPTTVESDGVSTSTITVTVRDAVGNPIPGASPTLTTTRGTLSAVSDNGDGTYTATLTSSTTPGTAIVGFAVGGSPSPHIATVVMEDTTAPEPPFIAGPLPGSTVQRDAAFTGTAEPGATVTIRDENGDAVCSAVVAEDGSWSCTPTSPLPLGQHTFTAEATDPSGNISEVSAPLTITVIGTLALTVANAELLQGASTTVVGSGFIPGETVSGVVRSDPLDLGTVVAGTDGTVSFTIQIPLTFDVGAHTVTLTGVTSGAVSGTLTVIAAPVSQPPALSDTGSTVPVWLIVLIGAALIVGVVLVVLARRSRRRR